MRNITPILLLLFASVTYAQEIAPTFEKIGNLVKATHYHDNGEIAQTGFLLNGKLHGQWFKYDEKGDKIASGKYDLGKRQGKWFFWDDNLLKEVDFQNNKILNVKNWNRYEVVSVE